MSPHAERHGPADLAEAARTLLAERCGSAAAGVWFAPGRVNLIGEHTDYNDGFVLPLAIDRGTAVALSERADTLLRVATDQHDETVTVALEDLAPGTPPGWAGYVAGVVWAMRARGVPLPGLDVAIVGDVPLGAGLSSSASVECAVGAGLDDRTGAALDRTELALLARHAENDFVGVPCGVMDQMASVHGREGHLVFLDTRTLAVEHVPLDLAAFGLSLLVVDTRAPHRLADGAYAERRATCEAAAAALGVRALRDVHDLDAALEAVTSEVQRRRVRHVVTENQRVVEVVDLLRAGADPRAVGRLLTASHASLRDDYEVTVPELDVAVDAALAAGAHGARMTGGGFGGSVIALVDDDAVGAVADAIGAAFRAEGFAEPRPFSVTPAAGARRLG